MRGEYLNDKGGKWNNESTNRLKYFIYVRE